MTTKKPDWAMLHLKDYTAVSQVPLGLFSLLRTHNGNELVMIILAGNGNPGWLVLNSEFLSNLTSTENISRFIDC